MKLKHVFTGSVFFCIFVGTCLLAYFSGVAQEQGQNSAEMTPESIARGQTVFFKYCAGCHGQRADGRGPQALNLIPRPQNLRNGAFVRYLSDERLYSSISGGIRGTSMPAFEMMLSADKRWDAISYIRSLTADYALDLSNAMSYEQVPPDLKNPIPLNDASIQTGQQVYELYCLSCHGQDVNGRGPIAANLTPRPRNLTVIISWGEVPFMNYLDDARSYDSITNGVPGTSMGPWIDVLSVSERWHVINYLRAEAKKEKTDYDLSFTEE